VALGRELMRYARKQPEALLSAKNIVAGGGIGFATGSVPGGAVGAATAVGGKALMRRAASKEAEAALKGLLQKLPEESLDDLLRASIQQTDNAARVAPAVAGKIPKAKVVEVPDTKQARGKGATYQRDAENWERLAAKADAKGDQAMAAKWRAKAEAARAKIPQGSPKTATTDDDLEALLTQSVQAGTKSASEDVARKDFLKLIAALLMTGKR
jgi:hypothetical protein